MFLTLDLPGPLEVNLVSEARREGISPEDRATLLLHLATALAGEAPDTPFRRDVRAFLDGYHLDPDLIAAACDRLLTLCLGGSDESSDRENTPALLHRGPKARDGSFKTFLSRWRDAAAHGPIEAESGDDPDVTVSHAVPDESKVPDADRWRRSALGKYSHLGGGTAEFLAEKRRDTAREDRS